jgi:hypothetical protein
MFFKTLFCDGTALKHTMLFQDVCVLEDFIVLDRGTTPTL